MSQAKTPNEPATIALRIATEADQEFLYSVYASTRADEVAAFGWDPVQQAAFLRMQFTMRQRAYAMQYPAAESYVIIFDEMPAGSMIVERTGEHISLTDIAVLPEHRKKGIATHLIGELQAEARSAGMPLVLSVDKGNKPAFDLYTSLGFVTTAETDFNYSMRWAA